MTLDELNQFRALRLLIKHEQERLQALRASTLPHSPRLNGMPHAPGVHDVIGSTVPRIVDLESEIKERLQRYQQEWMRVHQWINGITDFRVLLICKLRFEEGLQWEEVADQVGGRETGPTARQAVTRYLKKEKVQVNANESKNCSSSESSQDTSRTKNRSVYDGVG